VLYLIVFDVPLVPGGKLLDLGINMATWEPFFIPLGAPVFAAAGLASVIDPDAAAWINGAAADIQLTSLYAPSNQSPVSSAAPLTQPPMSSKTLAFALSDNPRRCTN
jgi:hypothetical protein